MVVELKKDGRGYGVDGEFCAGGGIGGGRIGGELWILQAWRP